MALPIKRLVQSSGIAYVLLLIAGFVLGPKCDSVPAAAFDACLLNNTARFGAQYFLHGLAALAFIIFVTHLSMQVQATQESASTLGVLMLVAGALWSALWLLVIGLAAAASDPGDFEVNADGARSTFVLTNALLFAEASGVLYLPIALFLGTTALAINQSPSLPTWLGITAAALAFILTVASGLQLILEAWLVFPLLPLFMIWVIAASIVIFRVAG